MAGKLPTLIDNRGENTVLKAFHRLLPHSRRWDVATGYFEVGALLDLDGSWQTLEELRILLGDEVTKRTRDQLAAALRNQSDASLEAVKEKDDSLLGLAAVRQAIQTHQIKARVYTKAKFHAKSYLMDGNDDSLVDFAVVGSSNFTHPGLTQNIELNVLTTEQNQIQALRDWYASVWAEAEDVTPELLQVIERHLREVPPFEVWAKALYEYFSGRDKSQTEWERNESAVYKILSKYQRDGYHRALQIAEMWNGALLCDGVGLGKTFQGLMLLENALHQKKRVLLVVPLSAKQSVWVRNIDQLLKPRYRAALRELLSIRTHTDFGREGTISEEDFEFYRDYYDVVIVDEAHHFRHSHRNRAKRLMGLCQNKQVFLLTATPINNSLIDLFNLINFFAQGNLRHFARLGIQNLRHYFTEAEKAMQAQSDGQDEAIVALDFLRTDTLLKEVLIQRSRKFVMESEALEANCPVFPKRLQPVVIDYSLNNVYAGVYEDIKLAFQKDAPMLSLAIYGTEQFKKRSDDKDAYTLGYQSAVIGLIRTLLLKRLESSWVSFEASLEDLLRKMAAFVEANAPQMWETWRKQHSNLWTNALLHWEARQKGPDAVQDDEEENDVPDIPPPLDPDKYEVNSILTLTLGDMTQLVTILTKVYQKLSPQTDDKLIQLHARLDALLAEFPKVVIFTEFRDTARYLYKELLKRYPQRAIEELDSGRQIDRNEVIKRFAPHYNCTEAELPSYLHNQIELLVTTDVLSEGLNLQDGNVIVNYDVHWNPVRLMQRIGRVDRRMDLSKPIHHDTVHVFNFLPPAELEDLLNLLKRVSGKILRINKTLGLEAPVLRPEDDADAALKNFNASYEQQESVVEKLELELQELEKAHPALYASLPDLPRRLFSGKAGGEKKGIFAAYRYPAQKEGETGELRWYFREANTGTIIERIDDITPLIRCTHGTPRSVGTDETSRKVARQDIEKQKVNRHLRDMQAMAGQKAVLVCWMEIV